MTILAPSKLGFRGRCPKDERFMEKVDGDWLPALDLNLAYDFGAWLAERLGRKAR